MGTIPEARESKKKRQQSRMRVVRDAGDIWVMAQVFFGSCCGGAGFGAVEGPPAGLRKASDSSLFDSLMIGFGVGSASQRWLRRRVMQAFIRPIIV